MKKALLGLATAAALIVAAGAANADGYSYGSVKDVPPPAPLVNWDGFYIGAAVGYGIASTELNAREELLDYPDFVDVQYFGSANIDGISSKGFLGTLTIGYDRQVHPGLLLGIFGDYAFGDLDTSASMTLGGEGLVEGVRLKADISDSWAIGARLGYVHTPSTMLYVAAGYAHADLDWKITGFAPFLGEGVGGVIGSGSKSLHGWFIGGGIEHQLRDNLFIKLDYRYTSYDKERLASYEEREGGQWDLYRAYLDSETEVHTVRLGLNWKVDLFHRHQIYSEPLK